MGFRLTWVEENLSEEGHRVYRSTSPMDPGNLPAPLVTLPPDVEEWEDGTVTPGVTYYYRVGAFIDGVVEKVSDEFEVVAEAPEAPEIPFDYFAYWNFDQIVDNTLVIDQASGATHLSIKGSPVVVPGPDNSGALEFNGSGQSLSAPSAVSVIPTLGDFTVSCFVNVPSGISGASSTADDILFTQRAGTGTNFILYSMTSHGSASSQIRLLFDGETIVGPDLRGAGWKHVVVLREAGVLRLYVDAVLEGTNDTKTSLPISSEGFFIAESNNSWFYRGIIDDFFVYHRALNETEIQLLRQKNL